MHYLLLYDYADAVKSLAISLAANESMTTGKPVKLMLDRATELKVAGTRPSGFAEITVAADADGKIIGWDSHHWGTNGMGGGTISLSQFPYVFDFDNRISLANPRAAELLGQPATTRLAGKALD